MSGADRKNSPDLMANVIGSLVETPEAFEFMSAVQLLAIASRYAGADAAGTSGHRFISNPSLAYPETELTAASPAAAADTSAPTLAMNFFGLHGPTGVLPAHVTRAVVATGREFALAQVLDFFNDKFANTFARAAALAYPHLLVSETGIADGEKETGKSVSADPITRLLIDIAGAGRGSGGRVGPRSRAHEISISRYYAAAWRHRPMPLTSLQSILRDLLQVPVRVLPFEPLWTHVDSDWRLRLSNRKKTFGDGDAESRDHKKQAWVLGKRTRQAQGGVLIRIGPLDLRTFCRLLPPRAPEAGVQPVKKRLLWRICTLIGAALGPWADFVIQPVLAREDVHPWILRGHNKAPQKTRQAAEKKIDGEFKASQKPIPPAVLGRTMFLLRKPSAGQRLYPRDTDFEQLKITSVAVRRAAREQQRAWRGSPNQDPNAGNSED